MSNPSKNKEVILKTALCIGFLLVGGIAGWFIHNNKSSTFTAVRQISPTYKFINPLLFIENPESDAFPTYTNLKNSINSYVSQASTAKKASSISVYFRDLDSNQWIGTNENEKYSPASMLKVFTVIAALSVAETDPPFLSKEVTITEADIDSSEQDYYPPEHPIELGKTYSVQELLSHLIIESDNTANAALINLVGIVQLQSAYDNLKFPEPDPNVPDSITSQQYSHLFRILYSGTYLTHDLSEQVLDLLSRTQFTEGLVAGLPPGTIVSHKFGERSFTAPEGNASTTVSQINPHELHDCGIVYYPNHPYFICVMTKGNDFPTLANVIKDISNMAWQNMNKLYPQ